MSQVHKQFTIDEQEELAAATIIYDETATLVESAKADIQVLIDQAYGELQTVSQNQDMTDPNAVGGQKGTPKPKPAKIDDTLKPKAKLTNDLRELEAQSGLRNTTHLWLIMLLTWNTTKLKSHLNC